MVKLEKIDTDSEYAISDEPPVDYTLHICCLTHFQFVFSFSFSIFTRKGDHWISVEVDKNVTVLKTKPWNTKGYRPLRSVQKMVCMHLTNCCSWKCRTIVSYYFSAINVARLNTNTLRRLYEAMSLLTSTLT